MQAATDRLTWAQSPTFLAGLTASIIVADVLDDPEGIHSILTYALCYVSLLTATLSATLSALAAVYMQQQRSALPLKPWALLSDVLSGAGTAKVNAQAYQEQSSTVLNSCPSSFSS